MLSISVCAIYCFAMFGRLKDKTNDLKAGTGARARGETVSSRLEVRKWTIWGNQWKLVWVKGHAPKQGEVIDLKEELFLFTLYEVEKTSYWFPYNIFKGPGHRGHAWSCDRRINQNGDYIYGSDTRTWYSFTGNILCFVT